MSEHKKEAKASSAAKLQRMGLKLEDGSKSFTDERGGSPFEGLNSGNAGKMPITPSRFKRGGKVAHVMGDKAHKNLGKPPRKAAGGPLMHPGQRREPVPMPPTRSIADEYAAYHPDEPNDLGKSTSYARGGNISKKQAAAIAYKKQGSGMSGKMSLPKMSGLPNLASDNYIPRKSGGAAKHTDEAQDKKLMHKVLKKDAFKDRPHKLSGGAMSRYLAEAGPSLAGISKAKARAESMRSSVGAKTGRPQPETDVEQDFTRKMGNRMQGIERAGKLMNRKLQDSDENLENTKYELGRASDQLRGSDGMKKGGAAHKKNGGPADDPWANTIVDSSGRNTMPSTSSWAEKKAKPVRLDSGQKMTPDDPWYNFQPSVNGNKRGGKVMHHDDCTCKMCSGGMAERAHRATGGRTKGKTNVNIIISPQSGGQGQGVLGAGVGMGQPPVPPMMPQMPPQMPPMPQGGGMPPAPPAGGGLPPQLMAALAARGGGGMPPMGRKTGGRVGNKMPKYQEKDFGSGSGLGRLVKKKWPVANGTE